MSTATEAPKPTRQSDAELSALNKLNRILLALSPEERYRCVDWLADRHAERVEVAK